MKNNPKLNIEYVKNLHRLAWSLPSRVLIHNCNDGNDLRRICKPLELIKAHNIQGIEFQVSTK